MLNKSKLWAVALLIATFVAGVATGGAVSAAMGHDDGDGRREGRRAGYSERLQQELALTPTQRASVDTILDRRQTAMRELWQGVAPRFDSLRTQIRGEIMQVLDERQRTMFAAMIGKSDSTRAAHDRERGGRRDR